MAIAKIDFTLKGKFYSKGDEVKGTYEQIAKLNEKGYIEPLTRKEMEQYHKEVE